MAWTSYLKLIRFDDHGTFLAVAIPALFFSSVISQDLLKSLVILYFSFNVLLYGGIYTINDIFDIKSDKAHPLKRKRPLPSGEIGIASALFFALISISLGLFTGFVFFNILVFYTCILFLFLNLFYTLIAKRIPYLDLLGNAAPHALRVILAFFVIGSMKIPYLLVIAYFFLSVALTCIKRLIEKEVKGWEARQVLKYYTKYGLMIVSLVSFLAIIVLASIDRFRYGFFYFAMIVSYLAFILGVSFSKRVKTIFRTWFSF